MRLAVRHTTRYHFTRPVTHSVQRLRLTPRSGRGQTVHGWALEFAGARVELSFEDHNRNLVTLVSVEEGVEEVAITTLGDVETQDHHGVVGRHTGPLPLWSFLRQTRLTQPGAAMQALAGGFAGASDRVAMLHALSARVREQVVYTKGVTDTRTTGEEACVLGQGVCQDQAHVFVGAARLLGVPARYVSGYMMVAGGVGQEATHGWAEAHVDGLGWVGFDVANGISPDARYVRTATGADYREAAPVLGISYGAITRGTDVEVSVAEQPEDRERREQEQGGQQ